jgi:DNA-binding transcriptional LysR family regulator
MIEPKDIDLNLLVVFQEVFQERQISSVARRLNLSQPAVSNALARLRRTFGDALFVRTAQGMQPTPFAQQLAEPVASALQQVSKALNRQEEFSAAASRRHFTIAMTDVGEVYFMPALIEQCSRLAPGIQISTVRAGTIDLKTEMESGRVDLAIGAFDNVSGALYQRRLFRQNYVSMFRKEHPLSGKKVTIKEFLAAQHLVVSSLESPYDRINQNLEKAGIRRTVYRQHHRSDRDRAAKTGRKRGAAVRPALYSSAVALAVLADQHLLASPLQPGRRQSMAARVYLRTVFGVSKRSERERRSSTPRYTLTAVQARGTVRWRASDGCASLRQRHRRRAPRWRRRYAGVPPA